MTDAFLSQGFRRARPLVVAAGCSLLWAAWAAPAWAAPAKQAVTVAHRPVASSAPVAAKSPTAGKPVVQRKTSVAAVDQPILSKQRVAPASTVAAASVVRESVAPEAAPRRATNQSAGVRAAVDRLGLNASAALVVDQDSGEELYAKNADAVLPIASLTKLMTGLVLAGAQLPLDEPVTITNADIDRLKGSSSRLPVGITLPRGEMMQLALMSSENRAAHALGRTYPGGLARFVKLMNVHAQLLGMNNTHYVEPTGLSSQNRSSARDLAKLVAVASDQHLLRRWTTSLSHDVVLGKRVIAYHNTNALLWDSDWEINLQKTGYIREAGRCLVLQTRMGGRRLIMVFLDADSGKSRIADARRVHQWVAMGHSPTENYAYSN